MRRFDKGKTGFIVSVILLVLSIGLSVVLAQQSGTINVAPPKYLVILGCDATGKANFQKKLVTQGQSVTLRITPITENGKRYRVTSLVMDEIDNVISFARVNAKTGVLSYTFTPIKLRTDFYATLADTQAEHEAETATLDCSCGTNATIKCTAKEIPAGKPVRVQVVPVRSPFKYAVFDLIQDDLTNLMSQATVTKNTGVVTLQYIPHGGVNRLYANIVPVMEYTVVCGAEDGGSLKCPAANKKFLTGELISITINPDKKPRYEIDRVTVNNVDVTEQVVKKSTGTGTYAFTITQNTNVVATFKKYPLLYVAANVDPEEGGKVFPASWAIGMDKSRNFTCYPAEGWTFEGATLNGIETSGCRRNNVGNLNCKVVNFATVATNATFACNFRPCTSTASDCKLVECAKYDPTCETLPTPTPTPTPEPSDCNPLTPGSCNKPECRNLPQCKMYRIDCQWCTLYFEGWQSEIMYNVVGCQKGDSEEAECRTSGSGYHFRTEVPGEEKYTKNGKLSVVPWARWCSDPYWGSIFQNNCQ